MTLRRPSFALAAAGLAFAAALLVALALHRGGAAPQPVVAAPPTLLPGASTDQRIATLQTIVRDRPRDVRGYAALAAAYLLRDQFRGQKVGIICSGGNVTLDDLREALPTFVGN